MGAVGNYALVTLAYWGFTLTDGALRMLVLLYFHGLGYTPFQIASLFLFYEFFGIITNAVGGWIGFRSYFADKFALLETEECRSFGEGQPAFTLLCLRAVIRDLVIRPQ